MRSPLTITATFPAEVDFTQVEHLRLRFPSGKVLVLNRCHICRGFYFNEVTCYTGDAKDMSIICFRCEEKQGTSST